VSNPGSLPPPYLVNSPTSASRPLDEPAAAYTLELLSEFATREKRESMRALKWIKSGRVALARDLAEIEEKVVFAAMGSGASGKSKGMKLPPTVSDVPHAIASLIPVFEAIRSVYALPASSTSVPRRTDFAPISVIEESEPYYSPTLQSVTSALYCNPRLSTAAAVAILMELVEYERDVRVYACGGEGDGTESRSSVDRLDNAELYWGISEKIKMGLVLESIQRRVR
jgi:hypothetical protein